MSKSIDLTNKDTLVKNGISSRKVPGLYVCEDVTQKQLEQKFASMTFETYPHADIFGKYCHLGEYIHCPLKMAFEYAANGYSLEEWTFSLRNMKYVGGNVYKGEEHLGKMSGNGITDIYIETSCYPDSGVVDYVCAWDQGDELWMRYYFRFIDAMPTIKKPGTIVLWTNCKHPYYDRAVKNVPEYIQKGRDCTDRPYWVGDIWDQFDAIHKIEVNNLKRILEFRYANSHSK